MPLEQEKLPLGELLTRIKILTDAKISQIQPRKMLSKHKALNHFWDEVPVHGIKSLKIINFESNITL